MLTTTLGMMTDSKPSWQATADARRKKINNAIPASHHIPPARLEHLTDPKNVIGVPDCCGVLTQREVEITTISSATKLLKDIRDRVYTAVEVTTAFCKRASIAHQLVCCPALIRLSQSCCRQCGLGIGHFKHSSDVVT